MEVHSRPRRLRDLRLRNKHLESSSPSSTTRLRLHFFKPKTPSLSHQRRTTTTTSSSSFSTTNATVCLNACSATRYWVKLRVSSLALMMANISHGRIHVQANSGMKEKNPSVQQKRLELEHEVEELQRTLDHEEKVHQVLERALQPNTGPPIHIPRFLPKKKKELLSELVMVEDEIARLEEEIIRIQQNNLTLKSGQLSDLNGSTAPPADNNPLAASVGEITVSNGKQEKLVPETKPMFFINRAIRGDYGLLHGFSSKGNVGSTEDRIAKKRESQRLSGPQGKVLRRSGVIEKPASSPRVPPRHSTTSIPTEHEYEFPSSPCSTEKSSKKWQPNKLSERIMKCLICIFLRLMRTSRKIKPDELSTGSRSTNNIIATLSLRSFRADGSVNLKSSLTEHRETKQQDPYEIFKYDESLLRDIGPYKNLVKCTSSSLDIKSISSCVSLLGKLRVLLNNLHDLDLRFLTHQQKLSFWINMHNTAIMNGFLEHGLPSSDSDKVLALRKKAVLNIGGNKLNALAIEHFILRLQPSDMKDVFWKGEKDDKEDAVRSIYGLDQPEPNITFALCCGTKSSPAVRIYTADGISAELEKAKLEYLQASIVVTATEMLMIPKLLVWKMQDFAKDMDSLLQWICNQLPTSWPLKKSMVACLKGQKNRHGAKLVDILPCEFDFQYLLPI